MRPRLIYFCLLGCGVMQAPSLASAAELPMGVVEYLDYAVGRGQLVGVVVGYIDPTGTTIRAFGVASKETGKPVDADTVFEIGSITKTFTATLLAQEVLAGRVKLSTPAQQLVPTGVILRQVGERPITLDDLATHFSGLPRLPANFAPTNLADPYDDFGIDRLTGLTFHQNGSALRATRVGVP